MVTKLCLLNNMHMNNIETDDAHGVIVCIVYCIRMT